MKPRANWRQMEREIERASTLWCSWGRHKTVPSPMVKEQYPQGTICIQCQVQIMAGLEKAVFMPELSEAMRRKALLKWQAERKRTLALAPIREADPSAPGLVYYMRINGRIKIGYTTDLTKRSRAYPPDSELLAVEPGDPELERLRHTQFSRYLERGREWYTDGELLLNHIDDLADQYRVPHELMYAYTKHRGSNA